MPALLFVLAALAAPPAAPPPPPPPPVDETRFQHFLKVLPDAKEPPRAGADPAEVARLAERHPGREKEIEAILAADARCTAPAREAAMLRMVHATADRLGPERLDRMIAFYEGPDFARFAALGPDRAADKPLSAAEKAEFDRIVAAYPLREFAEAMQASGDGLFTDPAIGAVFAKCADARAAAFQRAKLEE
jgi:hypothetical protein